MVRKSKQGGTYSIYLSTPLADQVDALATREYRNFSNMVALLLTEALHARGIGIVANEETPGRTNDASEADQ